MTGNTDVEIPLMPMNIHRRFCCALIAVAALCFHGGAMAQAKEEARLIEAAEVLDSLRNQRDTEIPEYLLQRASGVAVIPIAKKVAFVFGGRCGRCVSTVRFSRGRDTHQGSVS